jgi:platelet-activating factor acetylhydrolase isoform II
MWIFAMLTALLVLPPPQGSSAVGRTRWIVTDPARVDPFDGRPRHVEVIAWYPADATPTAAGASAYLASGLDEVRSFAAAFGNAALMDDLGSVRAHAIDDASPQAGSTKLPLLLFAHGYTGVPAASTTLLEDLASHGYIVLSIVHPYEASAATIGDGTVVTMLDETGKLRAPIRDVLGEWKTEDRVLADVTSAPDDAERLRLLRTYIGGLSRTNVALERWVDDTRVVMSQLSKAPIGSVARRVLARADTTRVGVFGHSMGGVTAAEFCLTEKRCAAALNLDGSPQYGAMIDRKLNRPFLMVYSARPGRLGASDAIYRRSASRYYRVDVADTRHLDFTDMVMWPVLRERQITGAIAPERAIAITREIVREFFDQELRGRRSRLLSGDRQVEGIHVRVQ